MTQREPLQYIDYWCHYDKELKRHLVCNEFFFAKVSLLIVPNKFVGTWILPDLTPREMTWAAKYYAGERGDFEDHSGTPYAYWDCPWCGGETEAIPAPRIASCE